MSGTRAYYAAVIALRSGIDRHAARSLIACGLGCLAMLVIWAHSGATGHDMDGEIGMGMALTACVAVVESGIAGIARAAATRRRRREPIVSIAVPFVAVEGGRATHAPPSRAGPAALQVFLR
jgi:hypothetical protein